MQLVCTSILINADRDEMSTRVRGPGYRLQTKPGYFFIFYFYFFATRVLGTFHINPPLVTCNNVYHNARLVFTFCLVWPHAQSKTTVFHLLT